MDHNICCSPAWQTHLEEQRAVKNSNCSRSGCGRTAPRGPTAIPLLKKLNSFLLTFPLHLYWGENKMVEKLARREN